MACAGFQMAGLHLGRQTSQQVQGSQTLTGGADIVLLAFDDLDSDFGDLAQIDLVPSNLEGVARDLAAFEDALDCRQVEFRRHIHYREIFVIEAVMRVALAPLAARFGRDLVRECLRVAFHVHGNKACKLQQARIDQTAHALVFEAHALDGHVFKLPHRDRAAKVGDFGGRGVRVHGATGQGQRAGLRVGVKLCQIGRRGKRQRHGLTNRDHMRVRSQMAHEIDQIKRVILDIEFAFGNGNVAGIVPVCYPDFTIGQ